MLANTHTLTQKLGTTKKSIVQELKNFLCDSMLNFIFFQLMQCNQTVTFATDHFISAEGYSSPFQRSSGVSMIN